MTQPTFETVETAASSGKGSAAMPSYGSLDTELAEICRGRRRRFAAGLTIAKQGDDHEDVYIMLSGWSARIHLGPGSSRQIIALLFTGDVWGVTPQRWSIHQSSLRTLTACEVAVIPRDDVLRAGAHSPALSGAIWQAVSHQEALLEAWLRRLGRNKAVERCAHFFSEIVARSAQGYENNAFVCELPMRQTDLATALGLSVVHMNRVLTTLRRMGAIELRGGLLRICDVEALRRLCDFDAGYLDRSEPMTSATGGVTYANPGAAAHMSS